MSRLEIPLRYRTLWGTGDVLLRAELSLRLRDRQGAWKVMRFRADSGAEITTMIAWEASRLGLPMPQRAAPGTRHRQTGMEIRSGLIRAQVVGMDATEYVFPCFFLGDPSRPPSPAVAATLPDSLLGLSGVIDKIRLTPDGSRTSLVAPYGYLIVEKL